MSSKEGTACAKTLRQRQAPEALGRGGDWCPVPTPPFAPAAPFRPPPLSHTAVPLLGLPGAPGNETNFRHNSSLCGSRTYCVLLS